MDCGCLPLNVTYNPNIEQAADFYCEADLGFGFRKLDCDCDSKKKRIFVFGPDFGCIESENNI